MNMGRVIGVIVILLLPVRAGAVVTMDDLHALVLAGQVAPVEAALQAAVDADKGVEPEAQQQLFTLFTATAPEVEVFLDRWIKERPASPLAMTAMGWHWWKLGWTALGGAENPVQETRDLMVTQHERAFDLAVKAVAADPELVAASDLMLALTMTLGNPDIAPAEMERVMALHPNRGSLMRIFAAFAPQMPDRRMMVTTLCGRFAAVIKSVPDYDAVTCGVDAVYAGGIWDRDQRTEARQLLQLTANPVLDYARLQDAVSNLGPPQQWVRILEGMKAKRPLDTDEARALDAARAQIAGGLVSVDEWKIALAAAVGLRRKAADLDPYDPAVVTRYVATLQDAADNLGTDIPRDDLILRLHALLNRVPTAATAWRDLADMMVGDRDPGTVSLDLLAEVEPYYFNAVVYFNYDYDMVIALVSGKYWTIVDPDNVMIPRDTTKLSAADLQRLDEVVDCPMIRQYKILQLRCGTLHISADQCGNFPTGPFPIAARLQQENGRGSCQAEVNRRMEDLAFSPIAITFPPAP